MYLEESRQMTIGQVSIHLYMNESSFISPTRRYVKVLLISQRISCIIFVKGNFMLDQTFKLK